MILKILILKKIAFFSKVLKFKPTIVWKIIISLCTKLVKEYSSQFCKNQFNVFKWFLEKRYKILLSWIIFPVFPWITDIRVTKSKYSNFIHQILKTPPHTSFACKTSVNIQISTNSPPFLFKIYFCKLFFLFQLVLWVKFSSIFICHDL